MKFDNNFIRSLKPCYNPSNHLPEGKEHSPEDVFNLSIPLEQMAWMFVRKDFMEEKEMSMLAAKIMQKIYPRFDAENNDQVQDFLKNHLDKRVTATRQDLEGFWQMIEIYYYLQRGRACSIIEKPAVIIDMFKYHETESNREELKALLKSYVD